MLRCAKRDSVPRSSYTGVNTSASGQRSHISRKTRSAPRTLTRKSWISAVRGWGRPAVPLTLTGRSLCGLGADARLRRHASPCCTASRRVPARPSCRRDGPGRGRRAVLGPVRTDGRAERLPGPACPGAGGRPGRAGDARCTRRAGDGLAGRRRAHASGHGPPRVPAGERRGDAARERRRAAPARVLTAAPVAINARAAVRREIGGVERWARELSERLPALHRGRYRVMRPPSALAHRAGQAWEQVALPLASRGSELLLSPANTAPL